MKIRDASEADCRAVAEVHVASWRGAYAHILAPEFLAGLSVDRRETSWQQVLAEGASQLLVGCSGTSIMGFASFGRCRDPDAPPGRGELWALYVAPGAWSTGVGRQLWAETHGRLREQGYTSVSLWVLELNERAMRFYSAAGFSLDAGSAKTFELGGRAVREVRMVRAS